MERRERDSNPRPSCPGSDFQDRRLKPLGHPSIDLNIFPDELQSRNSVISSFFIDINYHCDPLREVTILPKKVGLINQILMLTGGLDESSPYVKRRIINIYLTTGRLDESSPYAGNMKPKKGEIATFPSVARNDNLQVEIATLRSQ